MKCFVIFILLAVFAYQLISIQAAPNYQLNLSLTHGDCPANTTTEEECVNFVHQMWSEGSCYGVYAHGKRFTVVDCAHTVCEIKGRRVAPEGDYRKPHPECCPMCVNSQLVN